MKDLKFFAVDTRLEEYMKSSKWKGKIFMEDEKTCYKDGFNDCLKQFEQEKCELLGIIQKKDELIKKLICCDNCKHFNKVRCCHNDDKCIWELAE